MTSLKLAAALGALALLGGCEDRIGGDLGNKAADNTAVSAEGKSEEGKISMKGPGFDVAFKLPEGLSKHVNVDTDSKIIYPGSAIGGLHIAAGAHDEQGKGKGEVEIRFSSDDAPDKIVAWYRDPARTEGFSLTSVAREGNGLAIAGTTKGDGDGFKVHIAPKSGGGTEGRLTVRDRS